MRDFYSVIGCNPLATVTYLCRRGRALRFVDAAVYAARSCDEESALSIPSGPTNRPALSSATSRRSLNKPALVSARLPCAEARRLSREKPNAPGPGMAQE